MTDESPVVIHTHTHTPTQAVAVKIFNSKAAEINNTTPNHLIRQEVSLRDRNSCSITINCLSAIGTLLCRASDVTSFNDLGR